MDKQQKNIERVVADKVLKDIHKIVVKDKAQEKYEKKGAFLVGGVILVFIVALFVLIIS